MPPTLHRLLPLLLPALAAAAEPPAACSARSGAVAPRVVELYTSEGCNSCPPADRWLATLLGRADVLPLAFHVDYWDRLGWTDRFASAAYTQRQHDASARSGARFVYTPQVLVDGRDWRRWPALPEPRGTAPLALQLAREGEAYVANLSRLPGAPAALAGYWAVTEHGHVSQVTSGENTGVTLHHDAVVRELQAVARIEAGTPLRFTPRSRAATSARQVVFVVTDAATGQPLQAAQLGC